MYKEIGSRQTLLYECGIILVAYNYVHDEQNGRAWVTVGQKVGTIGRLLPWPWTLTNTDQLSSFFHYQTQLSNDPDHHTLNMSLHYLVNVKCRYLALIWLTVATGFVFTARRYASAVCAVALSLSVCPSQVGVGLLLKQLNISSLNERSTMA